jgi:hypothetical protein
MRLPIGIAAALMVVGTAITAQAQQPAAPACETNGNKLRVFDTERREPFSGVLTTIPPNPAFDASALELLRNGTLEVRERLVYSRKEKVIRLTTFIIPAFVEFRTGPADFGTPPQDFASYAFVAERATLKVENIVTSCDPLPSIMWVGTMQQDFPQPGDPVYPGGWGVDVTGATFAFSTGYTTNDNPHPPGSQPVAPEDATNPAQYSDCYVSGLFNVTESVAGVGVAWAPCSAGVISFDKGKKDKD